MYYYEEYSIEYILSDGRTQRIDNGCTPGFVHFDNYKEIIDPYHADGWDITKTYNSQGAFTGFLMRRSLEHGVAWEVTTVIISTNYAAAPYDARLPMLEPNLAAVLYIDEEEEYDYAY